MSNFSFTFNGQTFSMKAPAGMTQEQAQALFKQQTDTGSLVGIKVGEGLSAATQAAGGLISAASQLGQQAAGLAGSLPTGTNLSSITASLGPAASAASSQVSAALAGGSAAFNSLTTGASGATASISRALSGATTAVPGLTKALTGFASSAGSLATQAVNTIKGAVGGGATNGINVADFVKQGPALSGISNLSLPDVTGTLAQASKLVGQGTSTISNALGVGKFGFDASQLERAGLVKPGTAASFLAQGEGDLTSVLKSPTVWTGKDGVKSLSGLLGNTGLQDKVQQGLMKTGLGDLKSLGIPTDKLNPQALSGLATNAAKSVPNTVDWAKNVPGLPANVKAKFDAAAVNGAFAVNLAQTKIDAPVLQETKPEPAVNTVDSATVDAAAKRVVGDDRVPQVSSSSSTSDVAIFAFAEFLSSLKASFTVLRTQIISIDQEYQTITQEQWNVVNGESVALRATVRARFRDLDAAAIEEYKKLPDVGQTYGQRAAIRQYNSTTETFRLVTEISEEVRKLLKDLANKISVRATSNSYSGAG